MKNAANFVQMLKSNPTAFLAEKFSLPQGVNSPEKIIKYLMDTGQVSQEQYNNAIEQAKRMGFGK